MDTLHGHAAGNGGYGQGFTYRSGGSSPTRSRSVESSRRALTTSTLLNMVVVPTLYLKEIWATEKRMSLHGTVPE